MTAMMTAAVAEVVAMVVTMIIAEMTVATVAMAVIVMTGTPLAESIATHAMIDTAAEVVMTVHEAAEDTLTVMTEVIVVLLVNLLLHPTMVIPLLVERLESHTEVVSALLVKFARSRTRNHSFGSAAFIDACAL
ncbi:hypothetical protein LHYA1_G007417 [Lachnellula hyalina]|uniref:Uncharacterized protein n=1 Tax=Lachnellula hyalina TaxID=1316788 RepID=A0A8H8QXD7_9HELO|nr:uncharacterized protein LHYA1_G007417 [Lachnellula hyalina]TVY23490.1 hypothetical protein LHYA1_G007417 [Lachnellula hyalina]